VGFVRGHRGRVVGREGVADAALLLVLFFPTTVVRAACMCHTVQRTSLSLLHVYG